MDSLSQIGLGAAVGVAVMGRRTPVWKAALWGAIGGTLPDLDVLIDQGGPIRNMVLHRAETHAPFWLTLFSLPFAAAVAKLSGEWHQWRRWWLAMWAVLVTHPLLDAMTVYGTQLALPFSSHPYGVGSLFIIDPLYTVPLLVGVGWALAGRGRGAALTANLAGLVLSTAYIVWSVGAQQHVERVARASLAAQGVVPQQVLVTPAPLQTLLWRVVVVTGEPGGTHFLEGFYSLRDAEPQMAFDRFDRGMALAGEVGGIDGVQRIAAFSKGFYKLTEEEGRVLVTDLRMGQEPGYVFSFAVAERHSPLAPLQPPEQVGRRMDVERGLAWLWPRMWGEPLPPPR
jgi:inner membrane protein